MALPPVRAGLIRRATRRAFIALLGVMLAAGAGSARGTAVRVGIYDNMPKVGMGKAGRPEGIFVDIIEAIAAKEGWELEYVPGTWREGLDRVAGGEIDLMPDVAQSKSRGARFAYHREPVLSDWFQIYARKGSGIRSIIDLAGKRVAVLDGSIQEEAFNQMFASFDVPLTLWPFPDYHSALSDVAQGRPGSWWSRTWTNWDASPSGSSTRTVTGPRLPPAWRGRARPGGMPAATT